MRDGRQVARYAFLASFGLFVTVALVAMMVAPASALPRVLFLCALGVLVADSVLTAGREWSRPHVGAWIVVLAIAGGLWFATEDASAQWGGTVVTLDGRGRDVRGDIDSAGGVLVACYSTENGASGTAKHITVFAKSTNDGATWTNRTMAVQSTSTAKSGNCAVRAFDADHYVVSYANYTDGTYEIAETTNGGTTFSRFETGLAGTSSAGAFQAQFSTQFLTEDVWIGTGDNSADTSVYFWVTTNGGSTFDVDDANILGSTGSQLVASDSSALGFIQTCATLLSCVNSTDGGDTWGSGYAITGGTGADVGPHMRLTGSTTRIYGCDTNPAPTRLTAYASSVTTYSEVCVVGGEYPTFTIKNGDFNAGMYRGSATQLKFFHDPDLGIPVFATVQSGANTLDPVGLTLHGTKYGAVYVEQTVFDVKFELSDALGEDNDYFFGLTDGRDVRTDYEMGNHSVYVREGSQNIVWRLNQTLTELGTTTQCRTSDGLLTSSGVDHGLTVTVDGNPAWWCFDTGGRPTISYSNPTLSPRTYTTIQPGTTGGAVGPLESFTGNVLSGMTAGNPNWYGGADAANGALTWLVTPANDLTLRDLDLEKWGSNRTFVLYSDKLEGRTVDGTKFLEVAQSFGTGVAAHNSTLYFSSPSTLTRYAVSGGTVTLEDTASTTASVAGVRVTKDGRYVVTWSATDARVFNATNLDLLVTVGPLSDVRAADIDALNNYLYVVTKTGLFRFQIWDETVGFGGNDPDGANPPPAGDPFDPFDTVGDDPGIPAPPPAPFIDPAPLVDSGFFPTEGAARAFLGLLLVAMVVAAFWVLTESKAVTIFGAGLGFTVATLFEFFPLWAAALIFALMATLVVLRLRGSPT